MDIARTRSLFPHFCHLLCMAFSPGCPSFNTRIFWSLIGRWQYIFACQGGLLGLAPRKYPFSVEIQVLLYPSYPLKSSTNYCRESLSQKWRLCLCACTPFTPFPVPSSHESKEYVLRINQRGYKGVKINDASLDG